MSRWYYAWTAFCIVALATVLVMHGPGWTVAVWGVNVGITLTRIAESRSSGE